MSAQCVHGLDDPAWCSICKHGPGGSDSTIERESPVFPARYDGDCPECGLPILVGQPVGRWSDDRYRHEGCTP